ncbi:hypothetical protein D3OALGA1CA_598 [Olavius algarvensis associated proteobacterium Delta 3]|nr:hypothetical protein D3OALGA1CA_598 [Olavius algarvensis associated proteobacterium Delta 3]CAB5103660.1 hypothetical protein D3OALGB2SA_1988 [Olavius algarvensis associated proteobacterium Delta 3]
MHIDTFVFPSLTRNPGLFKYLLYWMPVIDPLFSGDQVRNDEIFKCTVLAITTQPPSPE